MKRFTRVSALLLLVACGGGNAARDSAATAESAFAAVQERVAPVMGVDQDTSKHVFEDLPDGGRVVLDWPTAADSAQVASIRRHMREVAADFTSGNFAKPFAVHAQVVPGTAVMAAKRAVIRYETADRERGAEVRIRSADADAVKAVHEFLAFQRNDHRAAGHDGHSMKP